MLDYENIFKELEQNCHKDDVSFENVLNFSNVKNRILFLDEIEEGVGAAIEVMIRFFNKEDEDRDIPIEKRQPIKIYINSPGGLLTETFMTVDAISMSKTPIWGIVTGTAYSGGFFTLLACHKRIAYPHASFLYHEGATVNGGTAGQFQNYAAFYKKELDKLKDLVIEKTNYTEETYKEIVKDDVWYDSYEALENGIIDEIAKELI